MKSIILHAPEVRRLAQGLPVLVVRPISPQPPEGTIKAAYIVESTCRKDEGAFTFLSADGPHGRSLMRQRCPLGQNGEVRAVRETWCYASMEHLPSRYEAGRLHGKDRSGRERWCYYASTDSDLGIESENGGSPWQSASCMPLWASRYRAKIENPRAVRCEPNLWHELANSGVNPVEIFKVWDRRYGKRYPWATSWAWAALAQPVRQ